MKYFVEQLLKYLLKFIWKFNFIYTNFVEQLQ